MENNETQVDTRISRLRELQKKQSSGEPWTEENRQELLSLQKELTPKPYFSDEEKLTLTNRQSHAGEEGHPPLTDEEIKKIQELNGLR